MTQVCRMELSRKTKEKFMFKHLALLFVALATSTALADTIGPKVLSEYDCTKTQNEKIVCMMYFADEIVDSNPKITFVGRGTERVSYAFDLIMSHPSEYMHQFRACLFGNGLVITTHPDDSSLITAITSTDGQCAIAD